MKIKNEYDILLESKEDAVEYIKNTEVAREQIKILFEKFGIDHVYIDNIQRREYEVYDMFVEEDTTEAIYEHFEELLYIPFSSIKNAPAVGRGRKEWFPSMLCVTYDEVCNGIQF